jgi:Ca2+-binding RTX toxin-like protein
VWTAGHCVFDDLGGGFATRFAFVPGYNDGSEPRPYGTWGARRLATTAGWARNGNYKYDLGAAIVRHNGAGEALTEVVGGRGIAFNQARTQTYRSYGYPAQQPPLAFTGDRLFRCTSPLGGTDNPGGSGPLTNRIACDMTGGSSGGGWMVRDRVLSVNSYTYCDGATGQICEKDLYGPYQESVAKSLYKEMAGKPPTCMGKKVTHLGTGGDDRLVGTRGRDVFKAEGGDDLIRGRAGKDRICAGAGDDVMRAGKGSDRCDGGRGRDRASSCERERRIP